ncbi:MAG: hypothetical protein ACLR8J_04270 [Sutterella wadsworthensis]
MPASSPLLRSSDHGTVDDVGGLVHEERDGLHVGTRFASVVSLAGIGREVGEDDGTERAGDGRVWERVKAEIENVAAFNNPLHRHDRTLVVGIERIGREALGKRAAREHRENGL